jgi:hypothetical protein
MLVHALLYNEIIAGWSDAIPIDVPNHHKKDELRGKKSTRNARQSFSPHRRPLQPPTTGSLAPSPSRRPSLFHIRTGGGQLLVR